MNDLVDTTEMYLRTIYDLEEEGRDPAAGAYRRATGAERADRSARRSRGWNVTGCCGWPATGTSNSPTRPTAGRLGDAQTPPSPSAYWST